MSKHSTLTLTEKIVWRVLFWLGLFLVTAGAAMASYTAVYVGATTRPYSTVGFLLIVLGIAALGVGYMISQGRIRLRRRKETFNEQDSRC